MMKMMRLHSGMVGWVEWEGWEEIDILAEVDWVVEWEEGVLGKVREGLHHEEDRG